MIEFFLVSDRGVQFHENVEQDQGKANFLRHQIRELEKTITDSRRKINVMEEGLKDYSKLKEEINVKESVRKMLKKQKDEQQQALHEEIEGQVLNTDFLATVIVVTVRPACSPFLRM